MCHHHSPYLRFVTTSINAVLVLSKLNGYLPNDFTIAATEVVIDGYCWGELSSEHLQMICPWLESSLTTLSQKVLTLSRS